MLSKGEKLKVDNSSKFYCLKFLKNGHCGLPFFAINDSFAKNRIYQSLISGTAPELLFDTEVELIHCFDFFNESGEMKPINVKVCSVFDINGVKEFIENVKKNDTIFKE